MVPLKELESFNKLDEKDTFQITLTFTKSNKEDRYNMVANDTNNKISYSNVLSSEGAGAALADFIDAYVK